MKSPSQHDSDDASRNGTRAAVAEHLLNENQRLRERIDKLETHAAAGRKARVAALNLMEDAVAAREEAERANAALRETEQRLRAIANLVPDLLWENDPAGATTWVNERWVRYTGQSVEDASGWGWTDVIHPQDREHSRERYKQAMHTGAPFDRQHRIRAFDGSYRWFLVRAEPMRDERGTIVRWFGSATDIENLKHAQAALGQSEERTRVLIENLPGGAAFVLDRDLRFVLAEGEALRFAGLTSQDLVGKTIFEALDPSLAQAYEANYRKALAGESFSVEHAAHGRTFLSRGVPLQPDGQEVVGVLVVSYDITERRRAEEALEQALAEAERARREAEAATQAKDQFLAVLSHELRTPLTPILMSTQIMQRRRDLPAVVQETLEMIQRNVHLEVRLVDDLLDVTRITRGRIELNRMWIDLHDTIKRAVEVTQADMADKHLEVGVSLQAAQSQLAGDPTRLQQVIWNLLRNAAKFTPAGGTISIRTYNEDHALGIQVADTGIGIASEALPRIFETFVQADDRVAREYGGLGLGLAIVRATVEAHGGQVKAESEGEGRGSTFTVRLPLATPSGPSLGSA